MTLFREMQGLLERTYGPTGVNLEDCIIGRQRYRELSAQAGATAAQISELGRVFLSVNHGNLRVGIYYDRQVIETLEQHNPAAGLTDENVMPFLVFLEELDHAVHASLKFAEGEGDIYSEAFVRELELQAKVDTYLILQMYCAFFNKRKRLTDADRRWLKACVFDSETFAYEQPVLAQRYRESNRLGRRYVGHLDKLTPKRRTTEIRRFRQLAYPKKQARIAAVCG